MDEHADDDDDDQASAPSALFDCVGVLVHSGSAQGGHYTALLRGEARDAASGAPAGFHEFNDANVKPIKESELQRAWGAATATASAWSSTSSAYMLLYRRKDASTEHGVAADAAAHATATATGSSAGASMGGRLTFLAPVTTAADSHEESRESLSTTSLDATPDAGTKRLRLSPARDGGAYSPLRPGASADDVAADLGLAEFTMPGRARGLEAQLDAEHHHQQDDVADENPYTSWGI